MTGFHPLTENNVRFSKPTWVSMTGFHHADGKQCPVFKNHAGFHTVVFKNHCTIIILASWILMENHVKSISVRLIAKIPRFSNFHVYFPVCEYTMYILDFRFFLPA